MKLNKPDMAALQRSIKNEFPAITPDQLYRAIDVAVADLRAEAEMDREESLQLDAELQLFDGLPSGTTLTEAARIKAAAGNPVAKALLAKLESRQYRLRDELSEAAMTRHPDFRRCDAEANVWQYTGADGEGPSESALIDWFQKTYPAEARVIEDGLSQ